MGDVEVFALRSLDLDLYEGELVVLLGPSGSGKSTLLNILGGLDTPPSGAVIFRNHNQTLGHVNQELLTTTAIITHNAAIAEMADRVIRLRSGEIAEMKWNEHKLSPAELAW